MPLVHQIKGLQQGGGKELARSISAKGSLPFPFGREAGRKEDPKSRDGLKE